MRILVEETFKKWSGAKASKNPGVSNNREQPDEAQHEFLCHLKLTVLNYLR